MCVNTRKRVWRLVIACNAFVLCSPAASPLRTQSKPRPPATRRWLPSPTLVRTITGPVGDELLMPVSLVATTAGQITFFDFGAMELRAFSVDGRQLWRSGRKGSGPGEFRNAMDVKVRPNGDITVLDMANRRITTVSSSGRLLRTTPVRFSSSRFIPLRDTTRFALTTEDSASLWSAVNVRGEVLDRGAAPPSIAGRHALVKEAFTAPQGAGSVVAFRWSDQLAILDATGRTSRVMNGIEPTPFPIVKSYPMKSGRFTGVVSRVDPHAVQGALSVASYDTLIFVLFSGSTPNRDHIIDVYNSVSGLYTGSVLLPIAVSEIAILSNNTFATLRSDPIPSIDIWASNPVAARTDPPSLARGSVIAFRANNGGRK